MYRSFTAKRLCVNVLLFLCAGCAASIDGKQVLDEYRAKMTCCASPTEFDFRRATGPGSLKVSITGNDPVFSFEGAGKSYFSAFELPPTAKMVVIKSALIVGNPIISTQNFYFYPLVTFLDAQKKPILTSKLEQLVYRKTNFENSYIELSQPVPSDAKFFIMHTSEQLLERQINFSLRDAFSVNGVPAGSGQRPLLASPISPSNGLEIEIQ